MFCTKPPNTDFILSQILTIQEMGCCSSKKVARSPVKPQPHKFIGKDVSGWDPYPIFVEEAQAPRPEAIDVSHYDVDESLRQLQVHLEMHLSTHDPVTQEPDEAYELRASIQEAYDHVTNGLDVLA